VFVQKNAKKQPVPNHYNIYRERGVGRELVHAQWGFEQSAHLCRPKGYSSERWSSLLLPLGKKLGGVKRSQERQEVLDY